jgi:hypothetical protein
MVGLACRSFVLGGVTSYLVVTPATAFCQSLLTRSVVMNLTERIKKDRGEFITYYNGKLAYL